MGILDFKTLEDNDPGTRLVVKSVAKQLAIRLGRPIFIGFTGVIYDAYSFEPRRGLFEKLEDGTTRPLTTKLVLWELEDAMRIGNGLEVFIPKLTQSLYEELTLKEKEPNAEV